MFSEEQISKLKNDIFIGLDIGLDEKGLNDTSIDWSELGQLISTSTKMKNLVINGMHGAKWKSKERSRQLFKNIAASSSIENLTLKNLGSITVMFIPLCLKNLANLCSLEISGTNMGCNGYDALAKLLAHPNSKFEALTLIGGDFYWAERNKISEVLKDNTSLKTLKLRLNDDTHTKEWKRFFSVSLKNNNVLVELDLSDNQSINNEVLTDVLNILANNTTLVTTLCLESLGQVTSDGWRSIATIYLQSPTCVLESIYLGGNILDGWTFREFVDVCENNKILKNLCLTLPSPASAINMPRLGWNPWMNKLTRIIYNKKSIIDTYNSNHVLETICYPEEEERFAQDMSTCTTIAKNLPTYLQMNRESDKFTVARRKILQSHYYNQDDIKANREYRGYKTLMETILESTDNMEMTEQLPHFMFWTGRDNDGLSLIYELMHRMPSLCENVGRVHADASAKRQLRSSKRKR